MRLGALLGCGTLLLIISEKAVKGLFLSYFMAIVNNAIDFMSLDFIKVSLLFRPF
jgi:hypothetical protein